MATLALDVFETPDLSLRQYMRGARLVWAKFTHHIRFPVIRVFLLICFSGRLDHTVPGYVRQPTTVEILVGDLRDCDSARPGDDSPKETVVHLMGGPVEGPIFWGARDAAGDSLFDVDVFRTLIIFVVLNKERYGGALDDFPR